jgi:urease alpha subunit
VVTVARKVKVAKRLAAVENTRKIGGKAMARNGATPVITADAETYAATADGSCLRANRRTGCRWRRGIF